MPKHNPVQILTIVPTGAIGAFRFASFAGGQTVAGQRALGVTHDGAEVGDKSCPVITLGTAIVEAGAAFAAEARLTSDAIGRAVAVAEGSGNAVNAFALNAAAAAGDLVEVVILQPVEIATMARAALQADSVAATVGAMVIDFNALLAKLKAAGIMSAV